MHVIGLDISLTDTGMSIHDTSNNTHITFDIFTGDYPSGHDYRKQDHTISVIKNAVANIKGPFVVFIEDYAFSKNMGKMFTRAELAGMIKWMFRAQYRVKVYLVKPNQLKHYTTGHGGGKRKKGEPKLKDPKAPMKDAVFQKFGYYSDNDNCVDAFALARYGIDKIINQQHLDAILINGR